MLLKTTQNPRIQKNLPVQVDDLNLTTTGSHPQNGHRTNDQNPKQQSAQTNLPFTKGDDDDDDDDHDDDDDGDDDDELSLQHLQAAHYNITNYRPNCPSVAMK